MSNKKQVILEGRKIGETEVQAVPGASIQLQTGTTNAGDQTFKTYRVESVETDRINVRENPLLG